MAMDKDSAEHTPPRLTEQSSQQADILDIALTEAMTPQKIKEIGYTAFKYYEAFLNLENDRSQADSIATREVSEKISRLQQQLNETQASIIELQSSITNYEKLIEKSKTYSPRADKADDIAFGVTWYPEGLTKDGYPRSYFPMYSYQTATSHALQSSYDAHFKLFEFREKKAKEFQDVIDGKKNEIKELEKEICNMNLTIEKHKLRQGEIIFQNAQRRLSVSTLPLGTIVFLKNIFRNIANPSIAITIEIKENATETAIQAIAEDNPIQVQKAITASNELQKVMHGINADEIRRIYELAQQLSLT